MTQEVTHEQIYERLLAVETKVDSIDKNTKGLVEAFDALQGAFKVLGWKDYCQALRDVPTQESFPWTIVWPVAPQYK